MNCKYDYNVTRHICLLKKSQLPREEYLELLNCNGLVHIHLLWEMRFELKSFFENYLEKIIDGETFTDAIFGMRLSLQKKVDQFILDLSLGKITQFYPLSDSEKLSEFFSCLFFITDDWEEDEYELPEFYNFVQKEFVAFQQILEEIEEKKN
jgi:hypothetical protein